MLEGTESKPIYRKERETPGDTGTPLWFIVCNEGWRETILCQGMYDYAADWLLGILEHRPFVPVPA